MFGDVISQKKGEQMIFKKTKEAAKKNAGKLAGGGIGAATLFTVFFGYVDRSTDLVSAEMQKAEASIYKYVDAKHDDVKGDFDFIKEQMVEQRIDIKEQRRDVQEIKTMLIKMQK